MKQSKFLTRCLALALALLLVVSSANLGLVRQVFAADDVAVNLSELIAENYQLTDAEKALITSGYLNEVVYSYAPFLGEGLVSVDTGAKTIKAQAYKGWSPVKAEIEAEDRIQETVAFADGVAAYTYGGNAFSVKVTYTYEVAAEEASQKVLLNAAGNLKKGLADLKATYNNSDAYVGIVVDALPALDILVEGFTLIGRDFGFRTQEARTATAELNAEIEANGGLLDLQVVNAAYDSSLSKTQYLAAHGAEYRAVVEATYAKLSAIAADDIMTSETVDIYMEERTDYGLAWGAFKSNLNTVIAALEPVALGAEWDTSALLKDLSGEAYLDLDAKLAAIEAVSAVAVKAELTAAEAFTRANLSMNNVNVEVIWSLATDEPYTYSDSAVLPTGSSAEAIAAVVSAIAAEAVEGWTAKGFVVSGYDCEITIPEGNLAGDIDCVVVYTPKVFNVDYCGETRELYFGAELVLDAHENVAYAYDYVVNGVAYEQGATIIIESDTVITRSIVKAYQKTSLYALVAEQTAKYVAAILNSGAVKGDEAIKYHMPEAVDAEELLTLENGTLLAAAYAADYAGLSWNAYTYGETGTENAYQAAGSSWDAKYANVVYKLDLTNYSVDQLNEVLGIAWSIRNQADQQIASLNRLNGYYADLESLDKTKLGALNGVIDVSELHADPVKNAELREYFKAIVSEIINTRLSGNKLKVYGILNDYRADGMMYYYSDYEYVMDEVAELGRLIAAMTADAEKEAALTVLTLDAGYPEYAEKIVNLGTAMKEIVAGLTVPHEAIDLDSKNLGKLVEAYEIDIPFAEGMFEEPLSIYSPALIVADETMVYAQITINLGNKTATFSTPAVEMGNVAEISDMMAKVEEFFNNNNSGYSKFFYNLKVTGDDINAYSGKALDKRIKAVYSYTPATFTAVISGEVQKFDISNPWIKLPVSQDPNVVYEYSICGNTVKGNYYKFSAQELLTYFNIADKLYEIEVTVLDKNLEELNDALDGLIEAAPEGTSYEIVRDEMGYVEQITANVAADQANLMSFAMGFVNLGYTYVGINGEPLIYMNAENTTEVCIQTLVNAILADEEFGSQTIIDLGLNDKGQFLTSTLQLGNKVDANAKARSGIAAENVEIIYDVDFILNITEAPEAAVKAAKALDAVKEYLYFESNDGILDVTLNLPEKVYEAYLTALLVTGTLDKDDVNAINNQIAFNFFYDYLMLVIEDETVTAQTFQNTLERLDIAANRVDKDLPDYDLAAYQAYYDALKTALDENVTITPDDEEYTFDFVANGKGVVDALTLLGIDLSGYSVEMGMIKEIKNAEDVEATVVATLTNTYKMPFEAALVDVRNDALKNKLDYEADLAKRVAELTGPAVIMLLDDVAGELVFDHPAIIDLNGKTIGKLTANSNVLVLDSNLANNKSGSIGAISGAAHLVAGKYDFPVDNFVVDGYEQNAAGYVQNALYTLESDAAGNLNLILDSAVVHENIDSYIQFAGALAADMALDLFVNYFNTAALYVGDNHEGDFNKIYDVDFNDFIGIISSSSVPSDVINEVLSVISLPDLADVVNEVVEDLLDFGAIAEALKNDGVVASYKIQTQPWGVNVEHIADGDYLTCGIVANEANAKTVNITLSFNGAFMDKVAKVFAFADKIVMDETRFEFVDVEELYYANKHFNLVGGVEAELVLDLSDYTTSMAIVMANGVTGAKRAAFVDAVNSGSENDLKAAFDAFTIADLVNTMKVVNRGDDLNSLAAAVGMNVKVDLEGKKELIEKALIYTMAAAGKALAKLEGIEIPERITNSELFQYLEDLIPVDAKSTLGALDKNGDGWYEMDAETSFDVEPDFRGYGVYYKLTTAYAHLKVNLFGVNPEYLLGDVNLDGVVDFADLTMVTRKYMEDSTQAAFNYIQEELADVDRDGEFTFADVTILTRYYMEDATQSWKPIYIEIPVQ